jgi:hypothetical protein
MADLEMVENTPAISQRPRTRAAIKTIAFTLVLSLAFLSGWTLVKYFHYTPLQGYLRDGIRLNFSNLQIEIALAGLTGLLASLLIQSRRRSRRTKAGPLKMTQLSFGQGKPVHPLMMTPRPSRDTKFVIRKTRKPGRISRNRMGERLPPSFASETENGPS